MPWKSNIFFRVLAESRHCVGVMEIHRLLHITVKISEGLSLLIALHLNRWFGFWFSFGEKGLLKHLVLAEWVFFIVTYIFTHVKMPQSVLNIVEMNADEHFQLKSHLGLLKSLESS